MENDTLPSLARFHSRYAPRREAERHVDAVLNGKRPSVVFIIGGGLNYVSEVLAERLPKALRVSLQPCSDFSGYEVDRPAVHWNPESVVPIRETIAAAIARNRLGGGIAVIEWPPVVKRYEMESERIREALRDVLGAASSDSATSAYWASRWLRNCVRLALSISRSTSILRGDAPVVIACAGPGLRDAISGIPSIRSRIELWSLASAVPALLKAGLRPDLAVSTDPGFWNSAHLREACLEGIPLAMPPSAFITGELASRTLIAPLSTGLSFERAAFRALSLSPIEADPSGSAAGTALSLALGSTSGPVALAGYDLAARGAEDHARPYAFDALDELSASRLRPSFSRRSSRIFDAFPVAEGAWRRSRPFSAYAATIAAPEQDRDRVLRLGDSPVETLIRRGSLEELANAARGARTRLSATLEVRMDREERLNAVGSALEKLADEALEDARRAIAAGEALPYDSSLFYRALAPRASADMIARAARGDAGEPELSLVDFEARAAAAALARAVR